MTQTAIPIDPATICERCRSAPAVHTHHRKRRSQGGDNSPENLAQLCAPCHRWIHDNPRDAAAAGWLVLSWQEPTEVEAQVLEEEIVEHTHGALAPGQTCPVCKRRMPKPRELSEPRQKNTITIKVPVDEQEDGVALWNERVQSGRELLCPVMGWDPDVPVFFVAIALFDKGLEAAKEDVRQMDIVDGQ